MYITENQSIGESVLFLLAARNTLADMVSESGHENSETMVDFLVNEASDYEIMSLLVDGVLPDEKYDNGHEAYLFSSLKESALMNAAVVSEAVGDGAFNDFMTKVDRVYPQLSTQGTMLEFFASQNRDVALAVIFEAGETATAGILKAKGHETLMQKAQLAPGRIADTAGEVVGKVSQAGGDALNWIQGQANSAAQAGQQASAKIAKFAQTPGGQAIGGAALAALLAYASVKTYKRFFSKAAKACGGQSGTAKSQCMAQYKSKAKAAQAQDLARGASACAKTKNPSACKAAIQKKIASLKG